MAVIFYFPLQARSSFQTWIKFWVNAGHSLSPPSHFTFYACYGPALSSKVSWSSYLLCISQFQVCPYTPGQLNCTPCQSCGWGISKLCAAQRSGIWQPQGHSRAFGTHMHSFLDITKHGGFYWRQQQIFRLTHLSWFYAHISPLYNQARSQELLSWTDNFLVMERNFCWSRIWL